MQLKLSAVDGIVCTMELDSDAFPAELARGVTAMLTESLIRDGVINPTGKTDEEIRQEFARWYIDRGEAAIENLHWVIDHKNNIVREARRYFSDDYLQLASVMYAMYFEHWLNYLLAWGGSRVGLGEHDVSKMLRGSSLDAKTSYLWQLVFDEQLKPEIALTVKAISEARNAFVHYKWRYHHVDSGALDAEDRALRAKLETCDAVVELTQEYERELYARFAEEHPLLGLDEQQFGAGQSGGERWP
ncbi:hypothetical protein [Kribbella sp. NPDC051770]|uniref:hypothetical protein n=1 Tax=Kribbella sp. NPDC051770 TaxID=3155413 RepID=UPI0034209072